MGKNHGFTLLFIKYAHEQVKHLGIGTTLNYIRNQGVWIPKGRAAVRSVLLECITCKKYNALSYRYPRFTDIPRTHMNLIKPYQHTGIDFTSHIYVKNNTSKLEKMYILIFTCLNIRAVHLELVPSMNTSDFLLAFKRFCNKFSIPSYIYSDNALYFNKGCKIIEESFCTDAFKEEFDKNQIKHVKINLFSPWQGSHWERLIKVIKQCLYKACLLYTSDAADERSSVDLGGRRIIKKKKK